MNFNLPKKVLVLYDGYTEERSVDNKGNIGAGKCLTRRRMDALVKELVMGDSSSQNAVLSSFVPSNVIFMQYTYVGHKIVFKTDARKQLLLFNDRLESLKSGVYAIPNLIWMVSNNNLRMFAYTKWEEENTELFAAPFANISDGKVCTGIELPEDKSDLRKYLAEVESIFWDTYFTHTTSSVVIKGNFAIQWNKMLNAETFNNKLLIPTAFKLIDLCK